MKHIIITGPTASGKSKLAVELARRLGAEIISMDSMKVYRGMDIGTAKPSAELRREIPYHFLDIVDPWESFSTGQFLPRALETVESIRGRGRQVLFQGGTALYLNALVHGFFDGPNADPEFRTELNTRADEEGLALLHQELAVADPEAAAKIHPNDRRRIVRALEVIQSTGKRLTECWSESSNALEKGSYLLFGIEWPREQLYQRINQRVERMLADGLEGEVTRLTNDPRGISSSASKCLGYRQVINSLECGDSPDALLERIQTDTRHFAKHQLTWFRRFPITWLEPATPGKLAERVLEHAGAD